MIRIARPWLAALALTVLLPLASVAHAQTLDPLNLHLNSSGFAIAVQPDGKLLVSGAFTTAGTGCGATTCPAERRGLARFNTDGSLDVAFNPGANGSVAAFLILPDGKILVAGGFTTIGGGGTGAIARPYLARLQSDGTVDEAFDAGVNGAVGAITLQRDGRILVGGGFSGLGVGAAAVPRQRIGRLFVDGTVDPTFDPGANGPVSVFALQADDRILVGGTFTMLGGGGTGTTPRVGLGRLDATGTIDAFNAALTGFYPVAVAAIAVQTDGQIIVGGLFETGGGLVRQGLLRLSAAGVGDATFNAMLDFIFPELAQVSALALQPNGKILIGGAFTAMRGELRPGLGRMHANGLLDAGFNPTAINYAATPQIFAIDVDDQGRVLAGGSFSTSSGSLRNGFARFAGPDPSLQVVSVSPDGSVVTWTRTGSHLEVDFVTFESTTDGVTWTLLGNGTRVAGGWELTGQTLSAAVVVRARGFGAGSIHEGVYIRPAVNVTRNASFTNGTADWLQYATPDPSYIVSNVNGGVFEFYRVAPPPGTSNQAVIFQPTGLHVPAGTPLVAQFDLGNSDSAQKRMGVLIHDLDFSELTVCTFWLEANAPMRTYGIATSMTKAMANATISFYAASVGTSGGSYRLDNISLQYAPGGAVGETKCTDPTAPPPPGGVDGPGLIINGDFASGVLAPGWTTFGQIQAQVTAGVAEVLRTPGVPAGVLLQATGQAVATGEIFTATFDLGNSTSVRRRVLVAIHDNDFSDLTACTFWLQPGQALASHTMRAFATTAWTDATISIYVASVGPEQWIRIDNVTWRRTPSAAIGGTECLEPFSGAMTSPATRPAAPGSRATLRAPAAATDTPLMWRVPMQTDSASGSTPRLVFQMWSAAVNSRGRIEISLDGKTWDTLAVVEPVAGWTATEVDVSRYAGRLVWLRFVPD